MSHATYIIGAKRTPIGSFQGQLSPYQGWQLGSEALRAASMISHPVEEVIMGCVLSAGQGQAPARQATCSAFGNTHIPATTVNKVCGSGMYAIACAHALIQSNQRSVVAAGGFESMTHAPYLLPKGRSGYRMGHGVVYDHMLMDGLEDAYNIPPNQQRRAMGLFADATAEKYGLSRRDQEDFARITYEYYQSAESKGAFAHERITLVHTDAKGNTTHISTDEPPTRVKPEKFEMLKPAFNKDGTVTAATSSSIADGAAACILCHESALGDAVPLARVVGINSFAHAPEWFTTAPISAVSELCDRIHWKLSDVDLFEINEAFAVVPMAMAHELNIDRARINIHGGACTLGHPIGASGARIVVTLIHALRAHGFKKGVATACIGGGEGIAIAIEIP